MAANSSSRGIKALGKRFTNQIWNSKSPSPLSSALAASRREAHSSSVYDKNVDDQIHSGPVPDDVINSTQSTKYWAPHPQTGVFGPPGEQATLPQGDRGFLSASTTDATAAAGGSVLEEKAWFRPSSLEDLEKPHPHL